MKRRLTIVLLSALTAIILAGCAGTDVVLKYAPDSFQKIVDSDPSLITDTTATDHYYRLSADGETVLKISDDYSASGTDDIVMETPIKPFTDAGLDPSKLGEGYRASGDTLDLTADFGNGSGKQGTVTDSLFESAAANRRALTYHQALDHYGIKLTRGKFEWAKDYTVNDKDIVFVMQAQPLKDLGVDVEQISGWTFSTVQEADGSSVDVLLRPFDLKT